MASLFTLFGAKGLGVPEVGRLVSEVLGVDLEMRESSYKGGEYFTHRYADGAEISIEGNVLDEDDVHVEEGFPEYSTLIYLNYSRLELEERLSRVKELDLLRSETV
ncbi:hypothetical protein AB0E62_35825 [Streptomyces sp. NPDC038707]|uniref:hypothetical protein n=1 Tax=Streptomyces sp. NPDC038707 TaxID=3154329 RepID=UPI0033CA2F03